MEIKLIEILMTKPAIIILMAIGVWLLTYVVKKPIKNITNKIKDEQKKKLANKWILLIPFALSLITYFVYHGISTKRWLADYELVLSASFSIAALAITIYNVFEGLRGKKSEYETNPDGVALYNLLLVYAKDKNKVKLLLDQCRENFTNHDYEISDTVKGWLPANVDADVINTIVKSIQIYLEKTKKEEEIKDEEIL